MRFMQIQTFYGAYLSVFYGARPGLAERPYQEQIDALLDDGYCGAHLRTPYLAQLGYECQLVISNCVEAQAQWAIAHGIAPPQNLMESICLVLRQIEVFKPDILYFTDPISFDSRYVRVLSYRPALVMGWRAAMIPPGIDWSEFDLILSSDEDCLRQALEHGAKASVFFRPHFPAFIAQAVADQPKQWDVVFSGQITTGHMDRLQLLCEIARAPFGSRGDFTPAFFLATGNPQMLPAGLAMYDRGSVWGLDMHRAIKSARILFNVHIDMAAKKSLNMRTFETVGTGSFLLTEESDVLPEFFEPGREVETYRNAGELLDKIYYYLEHDREREEIARRGQERCLRDFGADKGALELDQLIRRHLAAK